jgi:hypothetical protein
VKDTDYIIEREPLVALKFNSAGKEKAKYHPGKQRSGSDERA